MSTMTNTPSRTFVRGYRRYGDARHAYDKLRAVAGIPEQRVTVVARGRASHETLPLGKIYRFTFGISALIGALVGVGLWAGGLASEGADAGGQAVFGAAIGVLVGFFVVAVIARLGARLEHEGELDEVTPREYGILVDPDYARDARDALDERS